MSRARYQFRSEWSLEAAPDAVLAVLDDLGAYPRWWRHVRSAQAAEAGTALLRCRSYLPYAITLIARESRRDLDAGVLEAHVSGDIEGMCAWSVHPADGGCRVVFEEDVAAVRPLLRFLTRAARPLVRLNHVAMMASGRRGLARAVRARDAAARTESRDR